MITMSYSEAYARLFSLLANEKPVFLTNAQTGEKARFSKSSIGKLLSNAAIRKSINNGFSREQHYAAVSFIDHLFYNAVKLFERPDRKNDINVIIHRYASPIYFETNIALITVKETIQHGKRIYTLELMEIKKLEGMLEEAKTAHFPASSFDAAGKQAKSQTPTADYKANITQIPTPVKPDS